MGEMSEKRHPRDMTVWERSGELDPTRARLAAALWENRRLRRELDRAWGIVDELPLLTTLRAEDDYMAAKTQSSAIPDAMPAAGQADDGARKTQSDGTRTQCNVTTWSEEE